MYLGPLYVILVSFRAITWKIPKELKLLEEEARVGKITHKKKMKKNAETIKNNVYANLFSLAMYVECNTLN
jgi:hypothetical protein